MSNIKKLGLLMLTAVTCSVYMPMANAMKKGQFELLRQQFEKDGGSKKPVQKVPEVQKKVTECQICHKNFTNQDKIVKLSCGHVFHEICIDKWLGTEGKDTLKWVDKNSKCPICGKNVRTKYEAEKIEKLFKEANIVDEPKGQGKVVRETRDYIIINEGGVERLYHKK